MTPYHYALSTQKILFQNSSYIYLDLSINFELSTTSQKTVDLAQLYQVDTCMTRLLTSIPFCFASETNVWLIQKRTAATMYLTICNHCAATLLNWRVRRSSRGRSTIKQFGKTENTDIRLVKITPNDLRAQAAKTGVFWFSVSYLLETPGGCSKRARVYLHVLVSCHKGNQSTSKPYDVSENVNGHQMRKSHRSGS